MLCQNFKIIKTKIYFSCVHWALNDIHLSKNSKDIIKIIPQDHVDHVYDWNSSSRSIVDGICELEYTFCLNMLSSKYIFFLIVFLHLSTIQTFNMKFNGLLFFIFYFFLNEVFFLNLTSMGHMEHLQHGE